MGALDFFYILCTFAVVESQIIEMGDVNVLIVHLNISFALFINIIST